MGILQVLAVICLAICVSGIPLDASKTVEPNDLSVSGTNDVKVAASAPVPVAGKGDLKTSDSFGLGYYLPVVTPALVKYHYPLYYYPYLHSIRHHGYGGYGHYYHGHGVIH